jgi:pimeloyl-ACP methyl ester carboxylesterase
VLRSLAGGELFGETWGEGPPEVLVLHGWRRTHSDFATCVGPNAPEGPLPTLAPDLPGFGATPPPREACGSAQYADVLARMLDDAASLTAPVVVGHSLGGRVAVTLAAARPDLVGGLVLTGAPLLPGSRRGRRTSPGFKLVRWLHRAGFVGDARMDRWRRHHGSADYRAAEGVMREVLVRLVNERYDDALAAVRCPVELVWGDDDADAPVEVAQALTQRIPGATLTVCPGAGHLTPLTAPRALRTAVERTLARPRS